MNNEEMSDKTFFEIMRIVIGKLPEIKKACNECGKACSDTEIIKNCDTFKRITGIKDGKLGV